MLNRVNKRIPQLAPDIKSDSHHHKPILYTLTLKSGINGKLTSWEANRNELCTRMHLAVPHWLVKYFTRMHAHTYARTDVWGQWNGRHVIMDLWRLQDKDVSGTTKQWDHQSNIRNEMKCCSQQCSDTCRGPFEKFVHWRQCAAVM
jgi:hypothetical protein